MAKFYLLGNSTRTQMFGCVIQTQNKTIVIDGGTYHDAKQLDDFLKQNANSHVDAWFFTHPHHDHIGCFVNLAKNAPDITVDSLYYRFPDLSDPTYAFARSEFEATLWEDVKTWKLRHRVHEVAVGDSFVFDDVTVRVLRVFCPAITHNGINNSSAVYRIEGKQKSVLILGDLGVEGCDELMRNVPFDCLHTDYTQMAHHGQGGGSREFYEYIKPRRCIWAAPTWLWDNDSGNGFDTGDFYTVRTREWMAALGVEEHLIEKDGTQSFEI